MILLVIFYVIIYVVVASFLVLLSLLFAKTLQWLLPGLDFGHALVVGAIINVVALRVTVLFDRQVRVLQAEESTEEDRQRRAAKRAWRRATSSHRTNPQHAQ